MSNKYSKFDWKNYILLNPDLNKNWNNFLLARIHLLLFSKIENRKIRIIKTQTPKSSIFNNKVIKKNYQAKFGR